MSTTGREKFPDVVDGLPDLSGLKSIQRVHARRISSGLGGEIRAGDTGPALATIFVPPPSPNPLKPNYGNRSKRKKAKSLLQKCKKVALKHTWVTPLAMLIAILLSYAVHPTEANPMHAFIFMSYAVPTDPGTAPDEITKYGKGLKDITFVIFYMVVLSFSREFIMQRILRPLACRSIMLKSRAKQSRFMEQAYTAIYFFFLGPFGLYVMSRTPVWYFNIRGMYEDHPHRALNGDFKFYYLFQAAYWAQQFVVLCLGLEKPRKDFKELVAHHVITLILIIGSYRFHFTHMGIGVFITHDISDFFFATSKTLHYLDHPLVGPYFGFFILVWIYMRHYLNLCILKSEFFEFKTVGPYGMDWAGEQFKGTLFHVCSTTLLAGLQALNLFWLFWILRIAYKFVTTDELGDERSDDDEDEYAEEQRLDELEKLAISGIPGETVLSAEKTVDRKKI